MYQAEAQYLPSQETANFKKYTFLLKLRLAVYEVLRDREIVIFQEIADKISTDFPQETQASLERVLKDWLLIVRYCAMAMLLNDTTFLQHRLLEWLTDLVQVHQRKTIDQKIYELLQTQLQQLFKSEQMALIAPFLEQVNNTFLQDNLVQLPR
ncbi:phycobilisome protein [Gloeocapsopsis crepidinum LEGE 06123]|uniref:Phycobilisome protein n=1 Tax=Gloeocapsopsis crepidinum LEGE 06123 TaxID=588587 RepID=A0ABR9UQN9_9CHRO|nr:phycobilisome protein [Gloeocapsopsis crepidinum]MBE9190593.1 phycobilisome protein [Gloeocapsopsis crepidinum LEGE 06123]